FIFRAKCTSRVSDNLDVLSAAKFYEWVNVNWMPTNMWKKDYFGSGCDDLLNFSEIKVVGFVFNVHQHRLRIYMRYRAHDTHEAISGQNYFISPTNIIRHQCKMPSSSSSRARQ